MARQVSLSIFSAGGLVDPQMRESNDCYKGLSLLARLRLFLMAWMSPLIFGTAARNKGYYPVAINNERGSGSNKFYLAVLA